MLSTWTCLKICCLVKSYRYNFRLLYGKDGICFGWGSAWLCGKVYDSLDLVAPGSSHTGFMGVSLGKTLQSPSLVTVKPRKYMNS